VGLNTKQIMVNVLPDDYTVETPGEIVNLTATIENAELETLYWDPGKGSWNDGIGLETNGPTTRPLATPTSEEDYPFQVTVESTSRRGIRADGVPARYKIVTIRYQNVEVRVSPPGGCVENGKPEQFSATVLGTDDPTVTWTLENEDGSPSSAGSIGETTGRYVAPTSGSGTVVIVATSTVDPTAQGRSFVEYGPCECFWELVVAGDGQWTGNFASHDYGLFSPLFSMTFQNVNNSGEGIGIAQTVPGPGQGALGDFPIGLTFQTNTRFWSADENDNGTQATLTVTKHTEDRMEGFITGTAITVIGGEEIYRTFTLNFRSAHLQTGESVCGE
jgi:hypothetical protein